METSNRQLLPNYVLVTSSSEKPLKAPIRSQFDWSLISLWDWNPRVGCLLVAEPQPRSLWVLLLAQGGSFSCGLGWKVVGRPPPPPPAKGRHPLWLHLGCRCFAAIVEILNTGALAINKLISAACKKHLAWNETPSAAHQNWRGLHICFCWLWLMSTLLRDWPSTELSFGFLVHHSTERKRWIPRLSRECQRLEFGGGR